MKMRNAWKKPSDSEFCQPVTLRANGERKSFKILGGVALPSFTDPPN
jgi:hypothetical protein